MSVSSDTIDAPLLSAAYRQPGGVYDEMLAAPGVLRPHWHKLIGSMSALGDEELARRWRIARQRIRENGVTYNVYADPQGMERPWVLDSIPLLIPADEWRALEAGLIQRAQLLNFILADLYGDQQLLRGGHLPAALLYANPGFWRACHGLETVRPWLHLLAVDLARSPDGQWWVIADRTQAPSGAGYALENRTVLAETFPDLFREFYIERLASFFRELRFNLVSLAPSRRDNPRVVLLTPGPYNETYFEHSYLARYLGFPLVQGGDLTVRDSRVYLQTLGGLKPVDVILRRVDDGFCDPIELRPESYLGVAGLVEAVRAGNVVVANALGSGLIESPAFMPFLPRLCEKFLGEKLKLPSVATWWCGQELELRHVLDHLDDLVIKPAFPAFGAEPVFGGKLEGEERRRTIARLQQRPYNFAGQESVDLSTIPVWSEDGLAPRRVVLRAFLAASGDSWVVMPGGLTRVSPAADTHVVSMQSGGGSKDTWVLSDHPVPVVTLRPPRGEAVPLNRGEGSDLPSRAADHLFWLGRYAERAENLARVLRCILVRLTGGFGATGASEWDSLMVLYRCLNSPHSRLSEQESQGRLDKWHDLEQEILSLIFEEQRSDSLTSSLSRATRAAAHVRDSLSNDMVRVVSRFGVVHDSPWGYASAGEAIAALDRSIGMLAALRGIEMENITRGPGWHFLGLGRRIERSILLVDLLRGIIVPVMVHTWPTLEMLLEVADSSMTYRSRYLTEIQAAPVLDLLMNDDANPRSLAFQIRDLAEHCRDLANRPSATAFPVEPQKSLEQIADELFRADVRALCEPGANGFRGELDDLLYRLGAALPAFSDAITNVYFSHAEMERSS